MIVKFGALVAHNFILLLYIETQGNEPGPEVRVEHTNTKLNPKAFFSEDFSNQSQLL